MRLAELLSFSSDPTSHPQYPVYCLRFDRTGQYFVTGADDQIVRVFRLGGAPPRDGRAAGAGAPTRGAVLACTLRGHAGVVADLDVSADNALLATASGDGDVRVWGLRDGRPVAILRGHRNGANMVSQGRRTWCQGSPWRGGSDQGMRLECF